jgi:hypothetical protein
MLPPIEDAILQNNPKFALLHANLTANILNANGSTKAHPKQKERDAVTEVPLLHTHLNTELTLKQALKVARLRAAKFSLLKSTLSNLDLSPQPSSTPIASTSATSKLKPPTARQTTFTPLPTPLIELILLLSSYLNTHSLSPQCQKLLESTTQWASLQASLPQICALVSSHLQTQALALARIHSPTTNASYLHRSISKLSPAIESQLLALAQDKDTQAARRLGLVGKTVTLLSLHHLAITLCILHLEQSKHGLLSRHIKARTELLSLSAQQIECEAKEKRAKGERYLYTDEVKSALEEYMRTLRDGRDRLRERRSQAERELWGYGVGREGGSGDKEKIMKEIARAYKELQREIREVSRDVERLRGR